MRLDVKAYLRSMVRRACLFVLRKPRVRRLLEQSGYDGLGRNTFEMYQRMMDRVAILESHVNWRLYGLPAKLANLKVELAATVAGSYEIVASLQAYARYAFFEGEKKALVSLLAKKSARSKAVIVGSHNLFPPGQVGQSAKELDGMVGMVICDNEDVLSASWAPEFSQTGLPVVHSSPLTYLGALEDNAVKVLWLSQALSRQSPLKALLLLRQCHRVLSPGGTLAFYVDKKPPLGVSYSFDPGLLSVAGFEADKLECRDDIFHIEK